MRSSHVPQLWVAALLVVILESGLSNAMRDQNNGRDEKMVISLENDEDSPAVSWVATERELIPHNRAQGRYENNERQVDVVSLDEKNLRQGHSGSGHGDDVKKNFFLNSPRNTRGGTAGRFKKVTAGHNRAQGRHENNEKQVDSGYDVVSMDEKNLHHDHIGTGHGDDVKRNFFLNSPRNTRGGTVGRFKKSTAGRFKKSTAGRFKKSTAGRFKKGTAAQGRHENSDKQFDVVSMDEKNLHHDHTGSGHGDDVKKNFFLDSPRNTRGGTVGRFKKSMFYKKGTGGRFRKDTGGRF